MRPWEQLTQAWTTLKEHTSPACLHKILLAKDGLRKSGIRFETVDLSSGVRSKLTARLRGVKETPTLLDEDSKMKRYVGVAAISQYIKESKTLIRE